MRAAYDVAVIRQAEDKLLATVPPGTLMQRASTALARRCAAVLGRVYGSHVALLVGSGNNGGDALFAGAELVRRGARVDALLVGERAHADGLAAFRAAGGHVHRTHPDNDARLLYAAHLVVDGMVGIGGRGGLRDDAARLAWYAGEVGATVVAVDVPSGVDASYGTVDGSAVKADVTVTFGALKTGLVVAPGAEHAGIVEVVDIGLELPPPEVVMLDADDVAAVVPTPTGETDKYRRGVVGVVAGSETYTGAAVLAVGGALAAGAGMVRYVGPERPAELVRRHWPEVVVTTADLRDDPIRRAGRVQSWVVGSGLGDDELALFLVRAVLGSEVPAVVDADAINFLSQHPGRVRNRAAATVLTPHAGEFARLRGLDRGQVEAHRLHLLREAVQDLETVVLLKGSTTVVGQPQGPFYVNSADTPYLATAGSGDVLSGVCGALLAAGVDPARGAAAAAFLHGLAGLRAVGQPEAPITAMDLVMRLPWAIRSVRG